MSCLFNSLSKFVSLSSNELRQGICDYLSTNPLLIDDLHTDVIVKDENGQDLNVYVSSMRDANTMGGAIEIRAFCKVFKMNILVKSLPNNRDIEFLTEEATCTKTITWSGNHFEALL